MVATKIKTITTKANPFQFLDYGLGGKKKIRNSSASILEYKSKLKGGEHPSAKLEPFIPGSLKTIINSETDRVRRIKLKIRAWDGFYVACHTCAVKMGKEESYGDNWDRELRLCSNMISLKYFNEPGFYKGDDVINTITDISEYAINGDMDKPIITNDIIAAAFGNYIGNWSDFIDKPEDTKDESDNIIDSTGTFVEDNKPEDTKDESDNIIDSTGTFVEDNKPEDTKDESESIKNKISPIENNTKAEQPIISFDNDVLSNVFNNNDSGTVPLKQREKFDRLFSKLLNGKRYDLFKINGGSLQCVVKFDNGGFVTHVIDPGICIGDDYYVLVPTITGDTIPVHSSEVDILKKAFDSTTQKYVLTPEEHQKALSHMFKNQRIYSVIDMSNMGNRISKLKKDSEIFRKLGQKLTFVINCIDNSPMMGRLRFSKWNGIDDFELRSDENSKNKIRSPFPPDTLTYLSGVVIKVSGDEVLVLFNGNSQKYIIEEYGVL